MLHAFEIDSETLLKKSKKIKKEIAYIKKENIDWQNCALSSAMIQELEEELKTLKTARNCIENINFED